MGLVRLFLAWSVVVWHMPGRSGYWVHAGTAVVLFYIISGFYMALVVNERYGKDEAPGWRVTFYKARFLRIFPAYLAMLAFMVVWFAFTRSPNVLSHRLDMPLKSQILLAWLNMSLFGQDLFQTFTEAAKHAEPNPISASVIGMTPKGFFDTQWMLVGHAWTLGSELLFYLLAPFIVKSVRRIIAVLAASLLIRWSLIFWFAGFTGEIWGYRFFPATLCLFLLGSLAYHLYPHVKGLSFARPVGLGASIVIFTVSGFSIWRYGGALGVSTRAGYDTPLLWAAYLFLAVALPFLFTRWKDSRVDRWLGELSYPVYLVHGFMIGLVYQVLRMPQGTTASAVMALVSSTIAGAVMFLAVDRPVDAWRSRAYALGAQHVRSGRFRRGGLVAATAAALVLSMHAVYISAVAPLVPPPPAQLIVSEQAYNFVRYAGHIFAVPHGVAVVWGAPGFDRSPLVVDDDLETLKRRVFGKTDELRSEGPAEAAPAGPPPPATPIANLKAVSASGENEATRAARAMDGGPYSFWEVRSAFPYWLLAEYDGDFPAISYSLATSHHGSGGVDSTSRMPKAWTLQCSEDGQKWSVLDSRSAQVDWRPDEARSYPIAAPRLCRMYRFTFTEGNNADILRLSEIKFSTLGK